MESDSKKFSGIETLMDYLDCADSYVSGISRTEMAFAQIGHFILSFRHHLETLTDKPNFHTLKDLLLMLGNVARRISSVHYTEIVRLRVEYMDFYCGGNNFANKDVADNFVQRLELALKTIFVELDFFTPLELKSILPGKTVCNREAIDNQACFLPESGMTGDEATQGSIELGEQELVKCVGKDFPNRAQSIRSIFTNLADMFEGPKIPELYLNDDFFEKAKNVLATDTKIYFEEYEDCVLEDEESCSAQAVAFNSKDSSFTEAQQAVAREIERYLDSALKLAAQVGSSSKDDFALLKFILDKDSASFADYHTKSYAAKALDDFISMLRNSYNRLIADVFASQLAPNAPITVELAGTSGKTIEKAVHAKPAEKDYLSDATLRILFDVGVNTPANWRKGKSPPEGFTEAFLKRDYEAMRLVAERYKANRYKADAMNTKHVIRNISPEGIYRYRA